MDQYNLNRFIEAQMAIYEGAMLELARGRKDSHWVWYIFPQIEGLGNSDTIKLYAIKSLEEGRAYLKHPVLGPRLIKACEILLSLKDASMDEVMGFPDDLKLLSSMTLFEALSDSNSIFTKIIEFYFEDERDEISLKLIKELSY
jgi:uncharacterized protein (DUF1810 family)|tara:strand:+ start:169 stop:600 length:432 start_codon:yes stop_codon:yes gene_type:complete